MKQQHPDQMNEWFEPIPSLEGELMQVTDTVLARNIQSVEGSATVPEDDDDDNKLHPIPTASLVPASPMPEPVTLTSSLSYFQA